MDEKGGGLRMFRNRTLQWRLDGGIYFGTRRLHDRRAALSPEERGIVAASIRLHHRERYDPSVFAVMDDPVHALLQTRRSVDLGGILKSWKGCTANAISKRRGKRGTLWEKDSYTELLGHPAAIESRREYIYRNPSERWGLPEGEYERLEWFD